MCPQFRAQTPDSYAGPETSLTVQGKIRSGMWMLALFILVLVAALAQHFLGRHVTSTFAFDGKHYLLTCQKVCELLITALHGRLDLAVLMNPEFVETIIWDGPIIPSIPALVFAVFGRIPTGHHWPYVVVIYSVIHALSACVTATICSRVTERKSCAWVGGLMFGLYPPALIATGRFCSEVPTTFLMLIFILSLSRASKSISSRLIAGLTGGLIIMCKPVLMPAVVAAIIIVVIAASRKLILLISLALLIGGTILPWACYTWAVTGKALITAERGPTYNAAVACDLDTDGWCSMPESSTVRLFVSSIGGRPAQEYDSPLAVLVGGWMNHPGECAVLLLRRVTRLFSQPWNDFRESVFGISPACQVIIHMVIIVLGFWGAWFHLLGRQRLKNPSTRLLADLCVLFVAGHLGFALFQAMGRYGITAMPLLVALATYGLSSIVFLLKSDKQPLMRKGFAGLLALLTVAVIYGGEALTRIQESHEVAHVLGTGGTAEKSLDLSHVITPVNPSAILLLLDGSCAVENATIVINGHVLADKLRSVNHYSALEYLLFNTMGEHSHLMGVSVDDFRQWRAVPVPSGWVNWNGVNRISITAASSPLILYGDTAPSQRTMLSPKYFASDRMLSFMNSLEPRLISRTLTAAVQESSSLKALGQVHAVQLPDCLRIKLAIAKNNFPVGPERKSFNARSTEIVSKFRSRLAALDQLVVDTSCRGFRINKYILRTARSTALTTSVPRLKSSSHVAVRVTGMFRILKGSGFIGVPITLYGTNGQSLVLGKSPNFLNGSKTWKSFVIEDLVPVKDCGGALQALSVTLFPCPWQEAWYGCGRDVSDAQLADITAEIKAVDFPELSDKTVIYY